MMAQTTTVSGHCTRCTWGDRFVFHDTPWCPREFATGWIDTNEGDRQDDGRFVRFTKPSRPVAEGELILLIDTGDGEDRPFATWGRVVYVNGGYAHCVEAGWTDGPDGWLYTEQWETPERQATREAMARGDDMGSPFLNPAKGTS